MSKVLIVEDNATVLNLYRNALRGAGFTVHAAADGAAGLAAVSAFEPDAVLLDLVLPSMDGLTLLRRLRAEPRHAALSVVVFSNAYTAEKLNEVWEAGATQVPAKASTTPRHVIDAVRSAIAARTPEA